MPTYIKTGFWDKIVGNNPQQAKAPKQWLNLDLLISKSRGYKVYSALLTQTGAGNDPTAIVLENTLGPITYQYSSVGRYIILSSSLFTTDKTFILIGNAISQNPGELINFRILDDSTIVIWSLDNTGSGADDILSNTPIEIRVYN
jgi:hypothetical protein